jgi:uncharacterized protein YkwD
MMKKLSPAILLGFIACLVLVSSAWTEGATYVYDISQTQGNWKRYYVDIPSQTAQIKIQVSGGWGDSDLYARYTSKPTVSLYWKRSIQAGNAAVIKANNPPAGRLHIGLRANQAFGGVTLRVKVTSQAAPAAWRTELLNRVNYERGLQGRVPLTLSTPLNNAAQIHANDMAEHNFVSHTGNDGSDSLTRISRQGYFTGYGSGGCAENVAAGQTSVAAVMTAWMKSTGHRVNILNANYRDFGGGYVYNASRTHKHYWCQTFGYRR